MGSKEGKDPPARHISAFRLLTFFRVWPLPPQLPKHSWRGLKHSIIAVLQSRFRASGKNPEEGTVAHALARTLGTAVQEVCPRRRSGRGGCTSPEEEQVFRGRLLPALPTRGHHKGDVIHFCPHIVGGSYATQITRPSLMVTKQVGVVHLRGRALPITQHISVASPWRWKFE